MSKEIVHCRRQHTLMYEEVTLEINKEVLLEMLTEDLSADSKRELVQTYYLCKLKQAIAISPKTDYGSWNASIDNIENIYQYEPQILTKLIGHIESDDLGQQIDLINKLAGLSKDELTSSLGVRAETFSAFGIALA